MTKPLSIDAFRRAFPEITAAKYSDASVQIRLTLADKFFSPDRFPEGEVRDHAMALYTAHFLTLHGSLAAGGSGKESGRLGVVSSKSVDGASVSFDTGSGVEDGAGQWNLTTYGRELYLLIRVFGAGAIQL